MSRPERLYEFGPYRLDTAEQLLLCGGEPVPLTPKAFETLVALVERSGHLVEKDELMKIVWSDVIVEESNLTNNVYALRKLLGQDENGGNYIETVPKRGYRFTAPVKQVPSQALVIEKRSNTRVITEEIVAPTEQPSARRWLLIGLSILLLPVLGLVVYRSLRASPHRQFESIAVLPFRNDSGNADVEYLSDGVTESLINSLSQLSQLSVKAPSAVFRYKGKAVEPQTVAGELSVQAIVTGRVVQRGDDLTLYLSLVDGRNGNQLWGQRYDRRLRDLVELQHEIGHEVSEKVRARLSGVDEQKLAKRYTTNAEAYLLYLKGRYHVLKLKRSETEKGIPYFHQAIEIDPNYALAYVGLAEAYRALVLTGELPATEFMPKAKAAAQKAVALDNTLAAAHSQLGSITFWYDWDWREAERQCKRALELNPNLADAHDACARSLLATGQYVEALAEARRARELDPLNLRINVLEGQFLLFARRTDEALASLQKTLELDSSFWFAHLLMSSAYIDKGNFSEAAAEARKAGELAREISRPRSLLGYALAKSGRQAEARAELAALLKLSTERYVPPNHIALVHNGLGDRNDTLAWLERGLEQRDPGLTFLNAEQRWHNLRDDPRFQDVVRRVGLRQESP